MTIFSKPFAIASLERAIKTAAQSALLFIGADQANVLEFDWSNLGGFAAGGFVLSLLTSIVSAGIGDAGPSVAGENLDPEAP